MLSLSRIVAGVAFGFLLLMTFIAFLGFIQSFLEAAHV